MKLTFRKHIILCILRTSVKRTFNSALDGFYSTTNLTYTLQLSSNIVGLRQSYTSLWCGGCVVNGSFNFWRSSLKLWTKCKHFSYIYLLSSCSSPHDVLFFLTAIENLVLKIDNVHYYTKGAKKFILSTTQTIFAIN